MTSNWSTQRLGDILTLQRGFDLPTSDRLPGNFPVVSSSGITGNHDEPKVIGPGVVTGRYGTLGEVFYIESDFWPLNTTLWVRDFKGNDPRFVYYLLKSLDFGAYSDKSSVPGVNRNHLHEMSVKAPTDLEEQRRIAHVLGTLDDKIELNRKMNETLEEIARTLFTSWFVNFDPVKAKAAGEKPFGMDEATAALFPDSFVDSELGPIPKGWGNSKLCETASLSRESLNPSRHPSEEFDHFSLPSFDAEKMPIRETGGTIKSNKTLVPENAVLISKLNPHIPRIWLPDTTEQVRAIASTEFLVVQPSVDEDREYLYSLLSSDSFYARFASMVSGTTGSHQRVNPKDFLGTATIAPPRTVIERFSLRVKAMFQQMSLKRYESRTLAEIRDVLLPRLLSGELRVPEAESLSEEVAL